MVYKKGMIDPNMNQNKVWEDMGIERPPEVEIKYTNSEERVKRQAFINALDKLLNRLVVMILAAVMLYVLVTLPMLNHKINTLEQRIERLESQWNH